MRKIFSFFQILRQQQQQQKQEVERDDPKIDHENNKISMKPMSFLFLFFLTTRIILEIFSPFNCVRKRRKIMFNEAALDEQQKQQKTNANSTNKKK